MTSSAVPRVATIGLACLLFFSSAAEPADTFLIPPSGGDDTPALQAAFDAAVAAGPGSIVRLEAGTYCVNAPVVVRGFDGSWLGAGKGVTIVATCADPFPVPMSITADPAYPTDPPLSVREPFVFFEVDGGRPTALHVSDLTLQVNGTTQPYYRHGIPRVVTIFQNVFKIAGKRPTVTDGVSSNASVRVEHVEILGEAAGLLFGAPVPINIITGIVIGDAQEPISYFSGDFSNRRADPLQIEMTVENIHMERVGSAFGGSAIDSIVTIGGSASKRNTFELVGEAFRFRDFSRSRVEYSHNTGSFAAGPRIAQGVQTFFGIDAEPQTDIPLPELSELVITHNRFTLQSFIGFSNGIEIADFPIAFIGPETKTLDVLIAWNEFDGEGGVFAAVDGFPIADCLVLYNRIRGEYDLAGIALGYFSGPPPFPGAGCTLQGNNTQNASAGVAPVLLGPFSSDNLVVGGSKKNVLDVGTNNIVTGESNLNGSPPGPALQDAIERKRELLDRRPW